MRFSQRAGKRPIKTILQVESIDDDLKNRLWNVILESFFDKFSDYTSSYRGGESERSRISRVIWKEFFKQPIDQIPYNSANDNVYAKAFTDFVRKWFFKVEWYEVYDFVEFLSTIETPFGDSVFTTECNLALKREVAGYRIVNQKVIQITSEEEILSIEEASTVTEQWKSVNEHLRTALDMLADRKNPDYRNSIKESISAVESLCIIITGDASATLGRALSEIEKRHSLHGALKTAFSAIYGYTSDSSGIRHALTETDVNVEFEDAKFMLVSCSAFINYLKSKIKV